MTLAQAPLLVDGATHSAQTFRQMIKDLSHGAEGVTEAGDLKVTSLPVPGGGVQVGDGSAVIRGKANMWQGSYTAYNIGPSTVPIAPTGAVPRSDLIVLRVQDPEFEGGLDPAKDAINFFDVIPNVSSTTTSVPKGVTGVGLARLDIPANTGTITAAMIRDLRKVANPRRERTLYTAYPSKLTKAWRDDDKWHNWPPDARWQIPVPEWATKLILTITLAGLRMDFDSLYGRLQPVFGSIEGQDTVVDDNQGKVVRRSTAVVADTITLPASYRGTTQTLYMQASMSANWKGDLSVDGGTSIITDIEFTEGAV
ncbi:hypothetical protein OG453_07160 [Streptomyces sp. NBC_01381]|uniref:hypothetical protein n=1 Tax=Streptomyces sp. NBC_01381 TaxID=2903845 RepID=UPI002252670B|nr:hypothetical protein [Streptomyces sp. NBC_01381]MCX4666446.1 hypothetical protein [Streptomyces sp. NBC_01381]